MVNSKKCPKCSTTKISEEFYKNKARSDGLNSYCRICDIERVTGKRPSGKCSVCFREILPYRIYCSGKCRTLHLTRIHPEDRKCLFCELLFKVNHNYKKVFCSVKCSLISRNKSDRQKNLVSKAIKGRVSPIKGVPFTKEHRLNISNSIKGEKHWNWQGGISKKSNVERSCIENKEWRRAVFERDNYTCVMCGIKGGNLEADHIKSWAKHKDLRFEISNGRTLCKTCHTTTPNYKGRANKI